MSLLRSISTVGAFTMASRILGFVRDALIAALVGAGPVADAFFVAFKLPNLFRRLFAEGAFNAAFVPLYATELSEGGRERARAFADQAFAVLAWSLAVFVALAELAMPLLMRVFAPGFLDRPETFDLAVLFARIAFPYLLFVSLVSLAGGILNAHHRFAAAAATPILLNLCLIGAILGLARFTPTPGHALAWGVFAAGIVQCLFLFATLSKAGERLRAVRPALGPKVRLLLRRALPVAVGAGAYQINLAIDMIVASFLPAGSISYLFYADRISQLPLGVVGVAVGTVLLPVLSRQLRANDSGAAHQGTGQQPDVEPCAQGRRQRDADVQERTHQENVENEVGSHARDRDLDRGRGVLAGVEGGGQRTGEHISRQAGGVSGERGGGRADLGGPEDATAEQGLDHRLGDEGKRESGGEREQKRELDRPVLARVRRA